MDLLQLLAPAELPRVFDVLGEGAIQDGDFQSVFDTFLEADIAAKLEEGAAFVLDDDLMKEVLETLTDEQASLLMSFLVQVEIALDDPSLHLEGLLENKAQTPELEHEVPGSPGFAIRSLELAFEFTAHQIENQKWSFDEAKTQLSAYVKHWLKHEPCLDCKDPSFFAAHELIPADEYLKQIESEKKVIPQERKPIEQFLIKTENSNFKVPFFHALKVEEVHTKPVTPLQAEVQEKLKSDEVNSVASLLNEDADSGQGNESIQFGDLKNESSKQLKQKDLKKLDDPSKALEVSSQDKKQVFEAPKLDQKNVTVPQVQSRVDKALNWFAEQLEQIGKPENMEDEDWQKIMAWMQSKKTKTAGEAMEQLQRLGQLKRMESEVKPLSDAELQQDFKETGEEKDQQKQPLRENRNLRFQRAFSEAYQVVKSEENIEKAQEILKTYSSDQPETDAPNLNKPKSLPSQDNNPQLLGQVKSGEAKIENTSTTPKFTPPPSSNWDPELLNKFMQSTRESLKIWVEKKFVAMRIQIEPVELGKIQLKTIVEQGRIGVLIQAENQMTKELLQIHLHEMKEILKEQGLEVAGFQVDVKEQQKGFSEQKSSSGSKFELERLLEDDNDGPELSSTQATGLIDQVA